MIFQGPKGYIVQICEVHLQYGNSTTKMAVLHFFLVNSSLYIYILFSMVTALRYLHEFIRKPFNAIRGYLEENHQILKTPD